ncbi:NADH-ubiquinone oxidoreductase [Kosmotoga arenicorallina S304]|uniref:NADH-ubiquinone oxidoreductase n=1 Tax=Kosmotoga arenicorallina S304 TaxID=1453497 RepID=A0A176K344_9BACT|nr:proton-conducting transporter membrane subunit [Kosmotoga arenicorallina]OAA31735.1 NADH-ubiquinone oxidoreductase [Kosmotoga arenicorallina S304]
MIIYLSIIPLLLGGLSLALHRRRKIAISLTFASLIASAVILLFNLGKDFEAVIGDWGMLGISIGYDEFSLPFLLAVIVVLAAVTLNSLHKSYDGFFYALITLLLGSLNAVFITRDLFNVYVSFELASIIGFILIAYGREGKQIWATVKYMLIAALGFNFYLVGIGLVYLKSGTFSFLALDYMDRLPAALIFTGLSVKSGLFLLSMWLPDAHANAGTEISPILSGLMVKIEDYLVIRFLQYSSFEWLRNFYLVIGTFSAVAGVLFAMNARKAKDVLAYHTFSQIGFIIAASNMAAAWHAFSHAVFKGLLFMTAGNIKERLGTQKISEWKGKVNIKEFLPLIVGSAAIMGTPLTSGFVTKNGIMDSISGPAKYFLIVASIGTVISFSKLIFVGISKEKMKQRWNISLGYGIMVFTIFAHGIIGFDTHHTLDALLMIAVGIPLYFMLKSFLKPLPRILEKLDNSFILYLLLFGVMLSVIII